MRVLWFANVPTPIMAQRAGKGIGGGGHWIAQLLNHLVGCNDLQIAVATAYPEMSETHFIEDGVEYFVLPQPKRFPAFGERTIDIEKCAAIIEQFKPDLIHVHGSERFFGMLKAGGKTQVPMVVSIQGLLEPYSMQRHFFGTMSAFDILKSLRLIELPVRLGLAWQFLDITNGAKRERKILAAADAFLGRTEWDRVHTQAVNPEAAYYHVGEIMRPAFFASHWKLDDCDRHSLIYTNAGDPRRGTENLFAAVALLKREFPDIKLRLGGSVSTRSGYGRFIRRRIRKLNLNEQVEFLGYLDDAAMVRELKRAHVFAITSYIENSPNSLAEAMLVGMPCVASYVGGIPSMIDDKETGLLYPVEDVPLLANKIRNIFIDDELAQRLANKASIIAQDRHHPETVVNQLLQAYQGFLQGQSISPQSSN